MDGTAMRYDFTSVIDRRGKDAAAYDCIGRQVWGIEPGAARPGFDEIPMWVADMNFATCPAVTRALEERIRHPLYGYFVPTDAYWQAIIDWQTERHGWEGLTREALGYENGVHGGLMSAISVLTEPGEGILLHVPAYSGFLGDLRESGRRPVLSPLRRDEDGVWRMDFADMEERIRRERPHLAIFCSPHNPTGRVWERWEIERMMELFASYQMTVVSDEIWSDIVAPGHTHVPTATVSPDAAQRTVSFYAPSKTFNLAGLVGSYHVIPNRVLRERVTRHGEATHYNEMNVLSMHALVGAYGQEGRAWVDELNQVLAENCRYAAERLNAIDGCSVAVPQGTYMLFLDCGAYARRHGLTFDEVLRRGWDVGVAWQDGRACGWEDSIRLNVALPMARLREAMGRIERYVFVEG